MELIQYQYLQKKSYISVIIISSLLDIIGYSFLKFDSLTISDPKYTNSTSRIIIFLSTLIIIFFGMTFVYEMILDKSLIIDVDGQFLRIVTRFDTHDFPFRIIDKIQVKEEGTRSNEVLYGLYLTMDTSVEIKRDTYLSIYSLAKVIHHHTKLPLDLSIVTYTKRQYEGLYSVNIENAMADESVSFIKINEYYFYFGRQKPINDIGDVNKIFYLSGQALSTPINIGSSFVQSILIEVYFFRLDNEIYVHFIFDNFCTHTTQIKVLNDIVQKIKGY